MDAITLHDAFVAAGLRRAHEPQPAVTVGAGAIWGQVYDAVTTQGGPLRPGRRLHDRRRRRAGPERRLRQLLEGVRHRPRRACWRPRSSPPTATVRIANACTNPDLFWALKGGGGGSLGVVTRLTLRDARPAGVLRRGVRDDPGDVGRRVPPADRPDRRLLRREPAQPALGRADRLPAGQRARDRDGVPGAGPAAGGGGLAAVPRLAGRARRGTSASCQAPTILADAGAATSGTRRSSRRLPGLRARRRPPGRPRSQRVLGGRPGAGGAGPARLPVRVAARRAAADGRGGTRSPTRCSRRPGTGACRCTSTRASRARPPRRSPRPATRRRTRRCWTPSRC